MRLRTEAARLQAQAELAGGSATTKVSYAIGPDGKSYVASITVNKSVPQTQTGDVQGAQDVPLELNAAEQRRVAELQAADIAVRNHEAMHFRAAGEVASGTPEYSYIQGPDGQFYAVAGAVHVHTGSTSDPEKAARNAATMARAALAPGDASAADLQAAKSATGNAVASYAKASAAPSGRSAVPVVDFSA